MLGESLGGLVEDQQPRFQREPHRHFEQALVPVGQVAGAAVAVDVQAEGAQRTLDTRCERRLVEAQPCAGGAHQPALRRQRDVVPHHEHKRNRDRKQSQDADSITCPDQAHTRARSSHSR